MSGFDDFKMIKKTRKPHKCITCSRKIPIGSKAHNYIGTYEGEFQSWYQCDWCYWKLDSDDFSEGISGDEFIEQFFETESGTCPICKAKYGTLEWDWSKDETILKMECTNCDTQWEVLIGFDGDGDNKGEE